MARKTIKQLEAELAAARANNDANYQSGREWRAKADAAEAALKESRSHFADLKERLANAEAETARLRGYLDRVHEDDIVRDGMVEIEDQNGKRMVPKRPPPMRQHSFDDQLNLSTYGNQKRTHWTSY